MGLRGALALIVLAALSPAQEPFRVDVHLVNVAFAVRDSQGLLAGNLTADDFQVFDDGVPQKIAFFARSSDLPLSLGLIVDMSGSQEKFVKDHRRDLEKFLKHTLTGRDRAFLVCFGNHIRLVSDFTDSPESLTDALHDYEKGKVRDFTKIGGVEGHSDGRARGFTELGPPEHRVLGTAFYDAIVEPIAERLKADEHGSRALIVFSDGEDNSSAHNMLDAIEAAQAADVRVFAIRYTELDRHGALNARNKYGISVMARIARETGGADFDAREKDLASHFKEIGDDLRNSYQLAYHASNVDGDKSFHKIVIRSKRSDVTVRAKTGYFAR